MFCVKHLVNPFYYNRILLNKTYKVLILTELFLIDKMTAYR